MTNHTPHHVGSYFVSFSNTIHSGRTRVYCGTIPHSSRNLANGQKMYSDAKGMGVQWEIGENSFRFDFRIMELGPYDMVLGTDWMRSIGP